jgi:hypothetical protein
LQSKRLIPSRPSPSIRRQSGGRLHSSPINAAKATKPPSRRFTALPCNAIPLLVSPEQVHLIVYAERRGRIGKQPGPFPRHFSRHPAHLAGGYTFSEGKNP